MSQDFSQRYGFDGKESGGRWEIVAWDAGEDASLIMDPGEFHCYMEVVQF